MALTHGSFFVQMTATSDEFSLDNNTPFRIKSVCWDNASGGIVLSRKDGDGNDLEFWSTPGTVPGGSAEFDAMFTDIRVSAISGAGATVTINYE